MEPPNWYRRFMEFCDSPSVSVKKSLTRVALARQNIHWVPLNLIDKDLNSRRYAALAKGRRLCRSVRPIAAGEELRLDYHFSREVLKVRCLCGSPKTPCQH